MLVRPGIVLANLTDTGCVRERNEDYYAYAEAASEVDFAVKGRLAVVADGMGGHQGGEVASGIVVDTLRRVYFSPEYAAPTAALEAAFAEAHACVRRAAAANSELRGMGTTCTAAALVGLRLYWGHVGDSRLYLIRGSTVSQLTDDHSLVGRLYRQGLLSREEAAAHPGRNVLTAALGMEGAIAADFAEKPVALEPGDLLLLCTDGLHGVIADEELVAAAAGAEPDRACRVLIDLARQRGGPDNITVQLMRIEGARP